MRPSLVLNILLLVVILVYSILRDLEYQKQGPGDLRNRVVGARMIQAKKLPYFYKWKTGDSYQYLDYSNKDTNIVSNITATPFYHRLLAPVAGLQQRTIVYVWFVLQYLALAIIILAGVFLCHTSVQKLLVLNTGVLFTCTHAWRLHLYVGQLYIFIAALLIIAAFLVIKYPRSITLATIAGVTTAAVILIRPVAGVVLLPFLFSPLRFKVYLLSMLISAVIYCCFILVDANEKNQWISYREAMAEQIKVHQNLPRQSIVPAPLPKLTMLEGFNLDEQKRLSIQHPYAKDSENGNVFFIYKILSHRTMPLTALYALWALTTALLLALTWVRYTRKKLTVSHLALAGMLLYMITEIFAPVYRHQYNTVQWLPLILLVIPAYNARPKLYDLMLIAGLLLNITNTPLIPLRHTIGEVIILAGLLSFLFTTDTEAIPTIHKVD